MNRHAEFVRASGSLNITGACRLLLSDLQPEWIQNYDERPTTIDAPTFIPLGSVVKYNDEPLANMDLIDRRIA